MPWRYRLIPEMIAANKKKFYIGGFTLLVLLLLIVFAPQILALAGRWVVVSECQRKIDPLRQPNFDPFFF